MIGKKIFISVSLFYFLSGAPLGFFYTFLPVELRSLGIDLSTIGLLSLAGFSWSLKPLWAPLMDRFFYKVLWMALFSFLLGMVFISFSLIKPGTVFFISLLLFLTLFSAIFDTALDGWFIEAIPKELHGKANGWRISAYRLALIASGGTAVAATQFVPANFIPFAWGLYFILMCPLILKSSKFFNKASVPSPKKDQSFGLTMFYLPLRELFSLQRAYLILIFVFTYKAGDALLGGMVYPFWVDRGFSRAEIGLIAGTLGTALTITGALVGGYTTSRIGVKKALLYLGFLQALSNLVYAISALSGVPKETIYLASIIESFTGGLGTASFVTFLTSLCKKEFASSQYAILSMLFSLSTTLSRGMSGFLADTFGYALFFFLTFGVAIVPLFLLRHLPAPPDFEKQRL